MFDQYWLGGFLMFNFNGFNVKLSIKFAAISAMLMLASCASPQSTQNLQSPIIDFQKRELSFLIDACHTHLFTENNTRQILVNNGYNEDPNIKHISNGDFNKSKVHITYLAQASTNITHPTRCFIRMNYNWAGGPVDQFFKQKIASMGYRLVSTTKYGALNKRTQVTISNGENVIAFKANRSRNASGGGKTEILLEKNNN